MAYRNKYESVDELVHKIPNPEIRAEAYKFVSRHKVVTVSKLADFTEEQIRKRGYSDALIDALELGLREEYNLHFSSRQLYKRMPGV